jgi:hypothetical protein
MRQLRLAQLPAAIEGFHIGAIPVRAMPIPEVRLMEALHGKAVPEAPCLGRLRCRNADQEGDRPEGAENEFHRVLSCSRYAKENGAASINNPTETQQNNSTAPRKPLVKGSESRCGYFVTDPVRFQAAKLLIFFDSKILPFETFGCLGNNELTGMIGLN